MTSLRSLRLRASIDVSQIGLRLESLVDLSDLIGRSRVPTKGIRITHRHSLAPLCRLFPFLRFLGRHVNPIVLHHAAGIRPSLAIFSSLRLVHVYVTTLREGSGRGEILTVARMVLLHIASLAVRLLPMRVNHHGLACL